MAHKGKGLLRADHLALITFRQREIYRLSKVSPGLSQAEIARKLGISQQMVSRELKVAQTKISDLKTTIKQVNGDLERFDQILMSEPCCAA